MRPNLNHHLEKVSVQTYILIKILKKKQVKYPICSTSLHLQITSDKSKHSNMNPRKGMKNIRSNSKFKEQRERNQIIFKHINRMKRDLLTPFREDTKSKHTLLSLNYILQNSNLFFRIRHIRTLRLVNQFLQRNV